MEPKQNMSINKKQMEILTQFMSDHKELAKGILKTVQGRKTSTFLWEKIAKSLNTEGPPQKDVKDWKKTWSDLKYKVKNKLRTNKLHLKGTGGGPCMQKSIDELEEKIIECAGLEAAVEGNPSAKSFGARNNNYADKNESTIEQNTSSGRNIPRESSDVLEDLVANFQIENQNDENIPEEEPVVEYGGNSNPKKTVRSNRKENKENLMKQYVMATVTINNKLDSIHEMISKSQRTQKRRLEVEEKQYKLKKKKFELYEKNEQKRLQFKEAMLDIKKEQNRIRLLEIETKKF